MTRGVAAAYPDEVRLVIRGRHLPGRVCGGHADVHVGLQVGRTPEQLVPGDAAEAQWTTEIRRGDGDFRGAAVQGRRGERFVYLTWGTGAGESFTMFRRAKLMLADLPAGADEVTVTVDLTDEHGMPRCARLPAHALQID